MYLAKEKQNPAASLASALEKEPALVRFWREAYSAYEYPVTHGLGFHVPKFPDPLLGPVFAMGNRAAFLAANQGRLTHFNEIVPLGHDQRELPPKGFRLDRQFYLGERRAGTRTLPPGFEFQEMSLRSAMRLEEYWTLLGEGFARDLPFLKMLLPFLCSLNAEFRTLFLLENGRRVGMVTIGIAGGAALVLNEVVPAAKRGRGLSSVLSRLAENAAFEAGAADAFFWTEHAFFGKHADEVRHYRIFTAV